MASSLSEFFAKLATRASLFDEAVLAHLCRMAAIEAQDAPDGLRPSWGSVIGIWDWDVVNDRNHLDPDTATLFGVDSDSAAKGLPNSAYLKAIHPDDLPDLSERIEASLKGGVFEASYRIITGDGIRRVFAKGYCTLDKSDRPERLPGAFIAL